MWVGWGRTKGAEWFQQCISQAVLLEARSQKGTPEAALRGKGDCDEDEEEDEEEDIPGKLWGLLNEVGKTWKPDGPGAFKGAK